MENITPKILTFKYSTSRGRDTYGYTIVSLYVDGNKVSTTNGGGYDMRGTVLAHYIKDNYLERLKALKGNRGSDDIPGGYYGLTFYCVPQDNSRAEYHKEYQEGDTIVLDGACGISEIVRIADAIGITLTTARMGKNDHGYFLTDNKN